MIDMNGPFGRSGERRQAPGRFRIVERRSGFDRRGDRSALLVLRDNPMLLLILLVTLNVLSAVDWAFTVHALQLGAVEGNLLLSGLIEVNPAAAATFKAVVILLVSLVVWRARRYRLVLATSVVAVTVFALLVPYHIVAFATAALAR